MATELIDRLSAIIETGEVTRAGLARAAGLHPNSLRKLGAPDWNPTADTLGRLEKLIQRGTADVLVGPEAIIDEARNGRMFILVDDDDRENEGDLVIPCGGRWPKARAGAGVRPSLGINTGAARLCFGSAGNGQGHGHGESSARSQSHYSYSGQTQFRLIFHV